MKAKYPEKLRFEKSPMEEGSVKRELECEVVSNVAEVIWAIQNAKHVDQVICALHSIATALFPVDPSLFSGSLVLYPNLNQILHYLHTVKEPALFHLFESGF